MNREEARRRRQRQSAIIAAGFARRGEVNLEGDGAQVEDYGEFAEGLENDYDRAVGRRGQGVRGEGELTEHGLTLKSAVVLSTKLLLAVAVVYVMLQLAPTMFFQGQQREPLPGPAKKPAKSWQSSLDLHEGALSVDDITYVKGGPLYLVIAGHVFDVSAGRNMYGEGSDYHGFIGKDGTRAFVSGQFDDEGLIPDLTGLSNRDMKAIGGWIDFYWVSDKYHFMGVLDDWFFDSAGKPTIKMRILLKNIEKAIEADDLDKTVRDQFPPCNAEWSHDTGSRLWCSTSSGGKQRDWIGVPRVFTDDDKDARCACVHPRDLTDPRVSSYPNCLADSAECWVEP